MSFFDRIHKAGFDAGWPITQGGGPRWDESAHPRGKTTPASTPGSFAPAASATPPQYAHSGVELTPYVRSRIKEAARQGWVLVQNGAEHDAVTNLISARLDPNFGRWRDVAENLTADLFAYRDAMHAFPGKLQFPRENDDGSDLEAKLAAFLRHPPVADVAEPQSVLDARRARAAAAQAQYRVQSAANERARQEADWNRPEPAAMTKEELKRWDLGQPVPDHLPEAHTHIFNTRDSQLAYLDDLIPSKSAAATQASALNAARRFGGVLRGELPRRAPVSVRQRSDGRFEVVDGNSTVAALKLYGWHRVPVRVVG